MSSVQRLFLPADQWLYYKIHTDIKTADQVILEAIVPAVNQLFSNQHIAKWFFIRYSDPEFHIRLRLLLTDSGNAGIPMQIVN
jgi:thiopeptide-type bacteriocin biosynthesis protein